MIVVTFVSSCAQPHSHWRGNVIASCMLLVTRFLAGRSGRYFAVRQQVKLGDLNGYIEEMINGQKVVKVFCHEEAQEGFDRE